jgi:hypothetical protein
MKKLISFLTITSLTFNCFAQSVEILPETINKTKITNVDDIVLKSYVFAPKIIGIQANGTPTTPTATTNNSALLFLQGKGFDGTNFTSEKASINFFSSGNWTSTSNPTRIVFHTTATNTTSNNERMRIDQNGNVGIGLSLPQFKLEVGSVSGSTTADAISVLKDDGNIGTPHYVARRFTNGVANGVIQNNHVLYYLSSQGQFANSSMGETAFIKNIATQNWQSGQIGSRLEFATTTNSTNTPTTRLTIDHDGQVGIGTTTPTAVLDVVGTAKIGTNGTVLTEVIKVTMGSNIGSIGANAALDVDFPITNAATGSTVYVSPSGDLDDGLIIALARVSAAGNVRIKFRNLTGAAIDPPPMSFSITVIR